ncbi:glycosyltransferase family 4 protein [Clostridium beijerinckii]|uniref:glycosyltransferase family 4 protein n=1 Tax=Clostridium beijerinckii TaxID=1520 RepID=UPI0013611C20|nr:glycosyltransferase [Clostridium beijerinckii]MZK53462.1 glycosyltransferase [Clostridium beijerinckii]MZK61600.1 glycosyltransferase [Clostridium beijerinckii]MZK71886.1 glycosyltransferase [Clostridium beijerinckii]MZK77229.1 glycosyltransferase [Clostridium beijerinckii]MZK86857.1 glycosyltransferase [Clostridium beijerinckii]
MEINQFHSGTAFGDAITNQMLEIQKIIKESGYESKVYAQFIDNKLSGKINNIKEYKGNENNILIIHHSMGFDGFEEITNLPDKKIMIYHNITPEKYIDDEYTKEYIRIGLQQAEDYRKHVDYVIAASNYNRQELIKMGHKNIDVMPVQISVDRFDRVKENKKLIDKYSNTTNFLFVGRVVPNKCQQDVIAAYVNYVRNFNPNSKLFIVGDLYMDSYVSKLKSLCDTYEISDKVIFTGKVSEEDLKSYYLLSDVFLCMSEHEGFGVPLLEAMKMSVPVIAYRSSAIAETMGGSGILVTEKNYLSIAAIMNEIVNDNELKDKIIRHQEERIDKLKSTDTKKILSNAIDNMLNNKRKRSIQMQGPFETSYSLAIVNRKLIEAINNRNEDDASIYCTEGPGDYEPNEQDLKDKPLAKKLWLKSKEVNYPDVTIRNMYPPRVNDVNGGLNFQAFAWEETIIPNEFINNFNKYLDGVGTTSEFVTENLKKCGLEIPVKTIGNGVELPRNYDTIQPYKLKTRKKVKFLHISSCFPRKGIDVLLKTYYNTFTNDDDVCLVIKSFPNPHNNVNQIIHDLKSKHSNPPEIEFINSDLPEDELYSLYKCADCYIQVSRGEGFGLPVAEAMLAKIPVIVSPNTGMRDFCNEKTALLVDYEMEEAKAHVTCKGSLWAEPNEKTLSELMYKFVYERNLLCIDEIVNNAYELIKEEFSWSKMANKWIQFIDEVEKAKYKPKVDMITTWNNKCGIAEYTRFLFEELNDKIEFSIYPNYGVNLIKRDESYVKKRLWHSCFEGNINDLIYELKKSSSRFIHIQFNFGFFKVENIQAIIESLSSRKKVIITYHSTKDVEINGKKVSLGNITDSLNKAVNIVHQEQDKILLESFGVDSDNIKVIPHGQIQYEARGKEEVRKKLGISRSLVLGSYGFILPQKGIKENILAIKKLKETYPDVLYLLSCALHENNVSKEYYLECKKLVEENDLEENVVFVTDFLPNDEAMALLQACDILLMTYLPTNESASGAIRFCLAALRPIITTKQPIFDEFKDCVYQIHKNIVSEVAEAVQQLKDTDNSSIIENMKKQIDNTSWTNVAKIYRNLYGEIIE